MIKRLVFTTCLIVYGFLLSGALPAQPAYAAVDTLEEVCSGGAQAGGKFCKNAAEESDRELVSGQDSVLKTIAQVVVIITGVVSVIMIVIGGFKYVISAGDSSGTKSAKDTVLYAVIGLVIAVFAQVIVSFVLTRL